MTPEQQAREIKQISWDLFHLDCPHEWRNRGEEYPVARHRCGDCVREAFAAALAEWDKFHGYNAEEWANQCHAEFERAAALCAQRDALVEAAQKVAERYPFHPDDWETRGQLWHAIEGLIAALAAGKGKQ